MLSHKRTGDKTPHSFPFKRETRKNLSINAHDVIHY